MPNNSKCPIFQFKFKKKIQIVTIWTHLLKTDVINTKEAKHISDKNIDGNISCINLITGQRNSTNKEEYGASK